MRRAISRARRPIARLAFTRALSQLQPPACAERAEASDAAHASRVWVARYMGMLAPSQSRAPRSARRRSDGVVQMTYAAAIPAVASTTFATVRAFALVTVP